MIFLPSPDSCQPSTTKFGMRPRRTVLRFLLFFLILVTITFILVSGYLNTVPQKSKPGWTIIRPPHEVSALACDGETLWAGGWEGVFEIDLRSFECRKNTRLPSSVQGVKALLFDRSGTLWVGSQGGLIECKDNNIRSYNVIDGLPDSRVLSLVEDNNGAVWVGTMNGTACLAENKWVSLTTKDGLMDSMVNCMHCDENGGLWFGSAVAYRGGLSCFFNGRWQYFNTRNGLPHSFVNCIAADTEGAVWAATGYLDRGGACRLVFDGRSWVVKKSLTKKDGLAGAKVRSVFRDERGFLWFGSEYDGLAIYGSGRLKKITHYDGLSHNEVKTFLQDREGCLWIATKDGITCISREALEGIYSSL